MVLSELEVDVKQLTINQELLVAAIKNLKESNRRNLSYVYLNKGSYDEMLKLFDTDESSTEHEANDR